MNPQSISTSLLIATDYIRAMRGGAQSHMLTANDGHAYVVKFANNPQSLRVLVNEWLGCSIGRALGLTIPEPAILYVPGHTRRECTVTGDTGFQFDAEMFIRAGVWLAFHFG